MKQPAACPLHRGGGSSKGMQPWDTFLDFSRLMEPRVGWKIPICKRRLLVNSQSFALNYILSAFMGMVFVGFLLFNQRIVLASLLVTAVYHLGLLVPALAPDLALPTTSEKAAIMSIVGNAVFHWLSVWRLGTVLATAIGLLIVGHALGRPVPENSKCTTTALRRPRLSSLISEVVVPEAVSHAAAAVASMVSTV